MTVTRRTKLRVTAATLMVLAVLLYIPFRSVVGGAYGAGTANGGGTILFERQNHWYSIAPNGTHLHMLLSSTAGCPDFGCAAFSPDGARIMGAVHTADKMRITTAILNSDGSGYHALPLPDQTLNLEPGAWSPNGARIALHGWDDALTTRDGIYVVNASNGRGMVRLTTSPDGHADKPLAYSPDGSRLLFFHEQPSQQQGGPLFGTLFETTASGSGRVKLNPPGTLVTADDGSPASWSPDGKQLTFTAFSSPASGGLSAVYVEDANGTDRRRITPWGEWSTSAHWSPDGNQILFDEVAPEFGGPHSLYLVHPNGSGLKAITSVRSDGAMCCAVWSPDGKKLLTGPTGGGISYLATLNADGSGLKRLTKGDTSSGVAPEYAWGR